MNKEKGDDRKSSLLYRKDLTYTEKLQELERRNQEVPKDEANGRINRELMDKLKIASDNCTIFRNKEQEQVCNFSQASSQSGRKKE